MSVHFVPQILEEPKGLESLIPDTKMSGTPFRVAVTSLSGKLATIKVSRYSAVLKSPSITDRVTIVGVDYNFTNFAYGDKVWLETFYDRNLSPVLCWIRTGKKWPATVNNPAKKGELVNVYPNEFELITKYDLDDKIKELKQRVTEINTIKQSILDDIQSQQDLGYLTADNAARLKEAVNTGYGALTDSLNTYTSNMNSFFSGTTAIQRKLFKSYTLIAYTTKNLSDDLDGDIITPVLEATANTGIVQASVSENFKIVQALNNDLLLADFFYQDRYPCKLPIPYHRPVYQFNLNGDDEELKTTT